ncbi:MAG: hypothetical protein ACI8P0_001460, partial [Planctomycetaceae bacterium]
RNDLMKGGINQNESPHPALRGRPLPQGGEVTSAKNATTF